MDDKREKNSETDQSKRSSDGRFSAGNQFARGKHKTKKNYAAALRTGCTPEDFESIVRAAVVAAKEGDRHSRDWLTKFLIPDGEPVFSEETADEAMADLIGRLAKRG